MIISHMHPKYREKRANMSGGKYNGAFYYSREIVKNIIPNVETDRNWTTINIKGYGADHAIVFIHNNLHPENYEWMKKYNDLVLICGVPDTCRKVQHLGKPIYLPISIDMEYIKQFQIPKKDKTKDAAFAGRKSKKRGLELPKGIDYLEDLPRERLLRRMAEYRTIYAVGRTAIEARALGCIVKPYDPRFPDPELWQVLDNREAAHMLQIHLNMLDKQ